MLFDRIKINLTLLINSSRKVGNILSQNSLFMKLKSLFLWICVIVSRNFLLKIILIIGTVRKVFRTAAETKEFSSRLVTSLTYSKKLLKWQNSLASLLKILSSIENYAKCHFLSSCDFIHEKWEIKSNFVYIFIALLSQPIWIQNTKNIHGL